MKRLLTKTIAILLLSGCLSTGFAYEDMKQCITEKSNAVLEDLTPIGKAYALELKMQAEDKGKYGYLELINYTCKEEKGISVEKDSKGCFDHFIEKYAAIIESDYGEHLTVEEFRESVEKMVELLKVKQQCKQELTNHTH